MLWSRQLSPRINFCCRRKWKRRYSRDNIYFVYEPPTARERAVPLTIIAIFLISAFLYVSTSRHHSHIHTNSLASLDQHDLDTRLIQEHPVNVSVLWFEGQSVVSFLGAHILKTPKPCPVECDFHINRNRIQDSDAVIFNLPTFRKFPEEKYPNQKWVLFSMESAANYPNLKEPEFLSKFDLTMSYKLDSDIVAGYWSGKVTAYFRPAAEKTETVPVVYINSNCHDMNNRQEYVSELMKYIKVDAYGSCLRNKVFPNGDKGIKSKLEAIGKYRFVITFENSNDKDYVTEKIFHAFHVGTVPVYLGAPNIDEFLPHPLAAIKATDFSGPEKLAEYLNFLVEHPDEYEKHLAWRYEHPSASFLRLLSKQALDGRCRLCVKLHTIKAKRIMKNGEQ